MVLVKFIIASGWTRLDNLTLRDICSRKDDRFIAVGRRSFNNVDEILKAVYDDILFRVIECDIHVPEERTEYFSEMPPVLRIVTWQDDIGQHMRDLLIICFNFQFLVFCHVQYCGEYVCYCN